MQQTEPCHNCTYRHIRIYEKNALSTSYILTQPPKDPKASDFPSFCLCCLQAVVGLAVGRFADRAIAEGFSVGRLRKTLQAAPWLGFGRSGGVGRIGGEVGLAKVGFVSLR